MAAAEIRFRAMASEVHVIIVDGPPQAGATARRAIEQLEASWSRFIDSSDISRLNQAAGRAIPVDASTLTLIEKMTNAWQITAGRYDPTTLPALLNAGYTTSIDDPTVELARPSSSQASRIEHCSLAQVTVDRTKMQVTLPTGMAIDAGGIGKGLAADLVVAELLSRGASGALVSIGGDLAAAGRAPDSDGWTLDIEDPLDPTSTIAQVRFSAGGVATSSTRSRQWMHANTQQHHVIDPTTDAPATSDFVAATVIAACGWHAEAHATAVLLGGSTGFDAYTQSHSIEALGTTPTGATFATAALAALIPTPLVAS